MIQNLLFFLTKIQGIGETHIKDLMYEYVNIGKLYDIGTLSPLYSENNSFPSVLSLGKNDKAINYGGGVLNWSI